MLPLTPENNALVLIASFTPSINVSINTSIKIQIGSGLIQKHQRWRSVWTWLKVCGIHVERQQMAAIKTIAIHSENKKLLLPYTLKTKKKYSWIKSHHDVILRRGIMMLFLCTETECLIRIKLLLSNWMFIYQITIDVCKIIVSRIKNSRD